MNWLRSIHPGRSQERNMRHTKTMQVRKDRSRPSTTKQSTKSPASKRQSKAVRRRKFKSTTKGRTNKLQPKQSFPFAAAIDLARRARPLLDLSQPMIFHGSRHPKSILRLNALLSATRRSRGGSSPDRHFLHEIGPRSPILGDVGAHRRRREPRCRFCVRQD